MLMPTCGSLWRGNELTSSPKKAAECRDMLSLLSSQHKLEVQPEM